MSENCEKLSHRNNVIITAEKLLKEGYYVVPLKQKDKAAYLDGWENLRLTSSDFQRYFTNGQNIGIILGEPSKWLADVDLDCPFAVKLAPYFLKPTKMIHGRKNKPKSHWFYISKGSNGCSGLGFKLISCQDWS
jgi:hypothetical protein